MTTYNFFVDVRTLEPKIDDQVRIAGDDSALFSAVVEVTIDEAGLVRHWHFSLDDTLWRNTPPGCRRRRNNDRGRDHDHVAQPAGRRLATD